MVSNDFMGIDGFRWFIGVVADRNDPEKASRVRGRCFIFNLWRGTASSNE